MLDVISLLLVLTAVFAYLNHRYIKLPTTIGVMVIALLLSITLVGLEKLGLNGLREREEAFLRSIDFTQVMMQGMLSLLLFAGALHIKVNELSAYKWQISVLAIFGTIASALLVGFGTWYALSLVGITLPLPYCLLFGAIISPTDPISVLGILKSAKVPKSLEITIAGESLFNDGVGIVIFTLILEMVMMGNTPTIQDMVSLFIVEAVGGAVFGFVIGYIGYRMLKTIDNYQVEVLITLATVMGGYSLANELHISGPIAMVVVGLVIGNLGRTLAMSAKSRHHLDIFWELIDEILNAILFVLIGLEIVVTTFPEKSLSAALMIIPVTLLARFLSVGLPAAIWRDWFRLPPHSWAVLTCGGVRGGVSVALALSLPRSTEHDIIVMLTYSVVIFSIFGQGLTVGPIAKRVGQRNAAKSK
ncbi:MAG: sodium:proton antiporter [Pseudomonadota bacterium]